MHFTKRLLSLAMFFVTFGSATQSPYLPYSIDNPTDQELIDRQLDKYDQGFEIESSMDVFHPIVKSTDNVFDSKGQQSYSRKSAYY